MVFAQAGHCSAAEAQGGGDTDTINEAGGQRAEADAINEAGGQCSEADAINEASVEAGDIVATMAPHQE